MMKQGLGNAFNKVIREVLPGEVTAKQRYKGREEESHTEIWKKSFPIEDTSSAKPWDQSMLGVFEE